MSDISKKVRKESQEAPNQPLQQIAIPFKRIYSALTEYFSTDQEVNHVARANLDEFIRTEEEQKRLRARVDAYHQRSADLQPADTYTPGQASSARR